MSRIRHQVPLPHAEHRSGRDPEAAVRLLTRRCLGEALRLFAFYACSFLALVSVAVVLPLVRKGAPLLDVLRFLPDQLALPAALALPLAVVTAVMATIGRMRDDGELIALQAAGISALRAPLSILPLALVVAVVLVALTHRVLPAAFQSWREGKATLLRQAIATKVARREFLYQEGGTAIAADGVDGNTLTTVFAHHRLEDGGTLILHAPRADWVAANDEDHLALSLELHAARMLMVGASGDGTGGGIRHATGDFPSLIAHLVRERASISDKPDTRSTQQLAVSIRHLEAALAVKGDLLAVVEALLQRRPQRPSESDLHHWAELHRRLQADAAGERGHQLAAWLEPDLLAAIDRSEIGDPALRERVHRALDEVVVAIAADPEVARHLPSHLQVAYPGPDGAAATARYALDDWLRQFLDPAPLSSVLRDVMEPMQRWGVHNPDVQRNVHGDLVEGLRRYQMTWHLRWLLPPLALVGWLLAAGLALAIPARNRLVAVGTGLGTVLLAVLPGVGVTRGLGPLLTFDPAPLLWGPSLIMTVFGGWLLWRHR